MTIRFAPCSGEGSKHTFFTYMTVNRMFYIQVLLNNKKRYLVFEIDAKLRLNTYIMYTHLLQNFKLPCICSNVYKCFGKSDAMAAIFTDRYLRNECQRHSFLIFTMLPTKTLSKISEKRYKFEIPTATGT